MSQSLGDGYGLVDVTPDVINCIVGNVYLDGGEGSTNLGLTMETLFQAKRVNPRVARKHEWSYMNSGKLNAFDGGKCLHREIEDTSSLSYVPNEAGQHSQFENQACFCTSLCYFLFPLYILWKTVLIFLAM